MGAFSGNQCFVELHVLDFDPVVTFYGALGFRIAWKREPSGTDGYLVMERDGAVICFYAGNSAVYDHPYFGQFSKDSVRGYGVEIVFMVRDIGAIFGLVDPANGPHSRRRRDDGQRRDTRALRHEFIPASVRQATSVIVGARSDPHVQAVLAHCVQPDVLVFDVDALSESTFCYDEDRLVLELEGVEWALSATTSVRGWARRLAPQDWQRGVALGSRQAVEKTAWLSLLGAIVRSPMVEWLTDVDHALIAENKLYQLEVAARAGVAVPKTIVTNNPRAVSEFSAGGSIVKPLGPGHYFEEEEPRVFFTQTYAGSDRSCSATCRRPPPD